MSQARELSAFLPPEPPAAGRSLVMSLTVHALLVIALTWGLNWNQTQVAPSFEAEVWSAIPTPAAPQAKPPEPKPDPKPEPKPEPEDPPEPPPPPPPPKPKAPEVNREAEIALAKQRQQDKAKAAQAELEAKRKKQEAERKQKLEDDKKRKLEDERKQKLEAEKKRKADEARKKREAEENRRIEALRKQQLDRVRAMAGEASTETRSTQAKASGPSDSWAGRIQGAVLPRITFTEKPGNIKATVKVRLAPDGTIIGQELVKSSGNKAWDDAVLRALEKTGKLPRDLDGRVHSPVVIDFNPSDLQR